MSDLIDKAEALLNCPFCGGEATFSEGKTGDGKPWHYVECTDCEAMGPGVSYADHNIAVQSALADAWNRRAAIPARGVGVKPLVWETYADDRMVRSVGLNSEYTIKISMLGIVAWQSRHMAPWHSAETVEAAKAAAQADYEARILAALEPASGGVEATNMQKVHNAPAPVDATSRHYDRQADGKVREIVFVDEPPLEALVKAASGAALYLEALDAGGVAGPNFFAGQLRLAIAAIKGDAK